MNNAKPKLIYLNNSATSFPKAPGVPEAVKTALELEPPGHGRGPEEQPTGTVTPDMLRHRLAKFLNAASPKDIALTFNATDGLNLAIRGIMEQGDHAICTALDHNSVLRPLAHLRREQDINYTVAHASPKGEINISDIEKLIGPRTKLIIVNHISNVSGFVTDIYLIAELANRHGVILLVDAAQSGGHLPLNVSRLGRAMLAITGHKGLLGPAGTGALWVHPDIKLKPFRAGGTGAYSEAEFQPDERPFIFEAGTPNLHGIAGLHCALGYIIERGVEEIHTNEINLCETTANGLREIGGILIYGSDFKEPRGAVLSFNIEGIHPAEAAITLYTEFGIIVRHGLHCAPYAHKAMGTFPEGTIRISTGAFNTDEDINRLLEATKALKPSTK